MHSFAEFENAYFRGRKDERNRCVEIAHRWMREADTKLGPGWRTGRDIALAEAVAEGIAEEILAAGPAHTHQETSDE